MPYYTTPSGKKTITSFARYAEIMPYYTQGDIVTPETQFARYAEIMPYYTLLFVTL